MRLAAVVALVVPLVAGCTPYLAERVDFGTSAAIPGTGDIPPEYAQFNAYDPGISHLLADQICVTPYRPVEQEIAEAAPGKLAEMRSVCRTHVPIVGSGSFLLP